MAQQSGLTITKMIEALRQIRHVPDAPPHLLTEEEALAWEKGYLNTPQSWGPQWDAAEVQKATEEFMRKYAQRPAPSDFLGTKAPPVPYGPPSTPRHPYYCLECRTIEIYPEVPQQGGKAMLPFHEHEGKQVLLRPIDAAECERRQRYGDSVIIHQRGARQIAWPTSVPDLPDQAGDRLKAVLDKVAQEGW